jgi:small subunit ribosomal protein S7
MSRRISKKHFTKPDFKYKHLLVNILINRILKKGKKHLAKRIVYKTFELLQFRSSKSPIYILEKAIRNICPKVQLKTKDIDDNTYQVPVLVTNFKSILIAICWLIECSRKRSEKGMSLKLKNELIEASKNTGNSIKKKEELHTMAESNKAFTEFKFESESDETDSKFNLTDSKFNLNKYSFDESEDDEFDDEESGYDESGFYKAGFNESNAY